MTEWCEHCSGTGRLDCFCGGDLCVCGLEEYDCPYCDNEPLFDDDYGEWQEGRSEPPRERGAMSGIRRFDCYTDWPTAALDQPKGMMRPDKNGSYVTYTDHCVEMAYQIEKLRAALIEILRCANETEVDPDRCEICDWPLAKSMDRGCVKGNCSYRPDSHSPEWAILRTNRAFSAARAALAESEVPR